MATKRKSVSSGKINPYKIEKDVEVIGIGARLDWDSLPEYTAMNTMNIVKDNNKGDSFIFHKERLKFIEAVRLHLRRNPDTAKFFKVRSHKKGENTFRIWRVKESSGVDRKKTSK